MTGADVPGYLGLVLGSLWSFAPTRRAMIAVQLMANACFLSHWVLLGATTTAVMASLMMGLTLVSFFLEGGSEARWWRVVRQVYMAMLVPVAALSLATWQGLPSLFAALGTAVGCYARWQTQSSRYRAGLLAASAPWLVHDVLVGSWPAGLCDLFALGRGTWLWWQLRRSRFQVPAA